MTLSDILQSAQGGQAVANLAVRFGLTPDQAQAATQAMIPAFSLALERLKAHPESLGGLLTELASGGHGASYSGSEAPDEAAGEKAVAQVFGSPEAIRQVVQHVGEASGVAPETAAAMLPAVASILFGGVANAMAGQGLGGVLGELANAAAKPGGLDAALGSGGGLMGALSSIFGGSSASSDPQAVAMAAGLATLGGLFAAGVVASQTHQASLNAIAQSFAQPPTSF